MIGGFPNLFSRGERVFSFMKKLDRVQRALIYTCFYAFFCNGLISLTMGSLMPDMKAAYGLSDTVGGVMLSAHSIGNLVAGFVSSLIPLYLGRRRSVVLLAALGGVGMLMIALFGAPALLFVAFVFTGVGRGGVTNFNTRTVNVVTDGSPAASNLLHAVFAVGAISAPMIFLALRGLIGWQAGAVFVAVCVAAEVINFAVRVPDERPDRREKANRSMAFMKDPAFLVLAGMLLFYICSEYAINGWLVSYIQNKGELAAAFEGEAAIRTYSQTMATLLWAVILVGRLTCAWLSQRVHPKKLMLIAAVGEAVGFAGMLFSGSIAMVTVCVAVLGFCMAGICPMIYSDAVYFTNNFPLATGALLAIGAIGGVMMPTVVGVLADKLGFGGGMTAILVAIALLAALSAVNAAMKPRR